MRPRRSLALLAVAIVVAATACSSTKTPVSMPGSTLNKGQVDDSAQGSAVTVTVSMGDDFFTPTFVKAQPGATIHVVIEQAGVATHTFTIDNQHVDVALSKQGSMSTADVTLPANGSPVLFYCKYHQSVGMQGAFYSKAST